MTKKHFIALADHIKAENQHPNKPFTEQVIVALADFCYNQNTRFDRQRWMSYVKGECGPNGGKR